MGADFHTFNNTTIYGYTVTEIQSALNEMLVECQDKSENPVYSAGVEWAYITLRQKLGLSDQLKDR